MRETQIVENDDNPKPYDTFRIVRGGDVLSRHTTLSDAQHWLLINMREEVALYFPAATCIKVGQSFTIAATAFDTHPFVDATSEWLAWTVAADKINSFTGR